MHQAHNFEVSFQDGASIVDLLVVKDGSEAHAHVRTLMALAADPMAQPLPLLADAVHYLGLLHGQFPAVMDYAATHIIDNAARQWLIDACDAFAQERAYIARLAVELGPVPSTPGHHNSDATVLQLRHAVEMLAQSERHGCALGAATTLAIDWIAIRRLLDHAAIRTGLEPVQSALPDKVETLHVLRALDATELTTRAIRFGGRQLLHQHNSLWSMLESRAETRAEQ